MFVACFDSEKHVDDLEVNSYRSSAPFTGLAGSDRSFTAGANTDPHATKSAPFTGLVDPDRSFTAGALVSTRNRISVFSSPSRFGRGGEERVSNSVNGVGSGPARI